MQDSDFLIYNGTIYPSEQLLMSSDNRSFKYGDGFFETMKMIDGIIIFESLHFARLFSSLETMQFDRPSYFTTDYFLQQIHKLVVKNNHQHLARIRLMIFRSNGNIYDTNNQPEYIIQSYSLQQFPSYNDTGLSINVYKDARKTADTFSCIKSNNYLPYAMAAIWSKKNGFNDALIINNYDRIAEATTSNIFISKDGLIKTPSLTEGCIAGIIRRYLLSCFKKQSIHYEETQIAFDDVMQADEVFLTNTGWYIQWIQRCGEKTYTNDLSKSLYQQFILPLITSHTE